MPERKKEQRHDLTIYLRTEELQSLVDVLGAPMIGIYVEREDIMTELRGGLESTQLHVRTAVPSGKTGLVLSVMRQAKGDAHLECSEPRDLCNLRYGNDDNR